MIFRLSLIFTLILILFTKGIAQSLVVDGGFENITLSTVGEKEFFNYNNWIPLTPINLITKNGAPFFPEFIIRSKNNESKVIAYYTPFEGNSYLTCVNPSLRNLYQGKLVKSVKKGKTYQISFMLKVISNFYKKNKVENSVKNGKIGIWLTTKSLNDSLSRKMLINHKIKINPTVTVDYYSYGCEEQWISFSETWMADKEYNYVIVGNFQQLIRGDEIGYRTIKGVTYRIDNLKIEELSDKENFVLGQEIITDCNEINNDKIDSDKDFNYPVFNQKIYSDSGLVKYYQTIYIAENKVLTSDYPKAIEMYFSAFQYRKPYFTDYFNLKNILNLNISANKVFLDSLKFLNFSFRSKNKFLSNQIDSLFLLDQSCRVNKGSISVQDSLNHVFVTNLYESGKILSENTIGYNSMNKLSVILLHLSRYDRFKLLLSYLYDATIRGDLKNRDFAFLVDSYVKNNNKSDDKQSYYCTDCAIPIYSKFIIPPIDSISLNKYNNHRKSIYLEPLDEQYKKQYYNFKNGYELVNFYLFFSMFPTDKLMPESQKNKFLEQENILIEELKEKYGKIEIR